MNRPYYKVLGPNPFVDSLLGVWADDSDEEEAGTSRASFKSSAGGKRNYTAPVSFISGGLQKAEKKKEITSKKDEDVESEEEEQVGFGRRRKEKDIADTSR